MVFSWNQSQGKSEVGNQTKYQHVQEVFVSNLKKAEQAMMCAQSYDMISIVMIPVIKESLVRKPSDKFNNNGKNIFSTGSPYCGRVFVNGNVQAARRVCLRIVPATNVGIVLLYKTGLVPGWYRYVQF